jgi:hypothetical protein
MVIASTASSALCAYALYQAARTTTPSNGFPVSLSTTCPFHGPSAVAGSMTQREPSKKTTTKARPANSSGLTKPKEALECPPRTRCLRPHFELAALGWHIPRLAAASAHRRF